jgi:type I restriction enzyme S subunit
MTTENNTSSLRGTKQSVSLIPKLRFKEFEGDWDLHFLKDFINKIGSGWSPKCLSIPAKKGEWGSLKTTSISWNGYKPEENKKIPKHLEPRKDIEVCLDDILITRVGPRDRVGVVVHIDKDWSKLMVSDNMFRLKLQGEVLPIFLPLILGSINVQKSWKSKIAGLASAQVVINHTILNKTKLHLPKLPEQQKIASFLTSVDTKIQQLTTKNQLLENYKKGVMQQLFSQQLRFKNDDGFGFPDWEEKKLGEIGKIITGKTPNTSKKELWNGDIQFITPTDIEENKKFQRETKRTIVRTKNINILPVNSIVYTCIASIGKMCLTTKESITNQQINSIITHKNYNFEYVYYYLLFLTPKIKSTQANTTLPIINKTDFSKFRIKIPTLKEQEKIASYLSAIDKKIENVQTQIDKTQAFKKGLLQGMFV